MKRRQHDAQNRFAVLPTPARLIGDGQHTGKGVSIAFILTLQFSGITDDPFRHIVCVNRILDRGILMRGGKAQRIPSRWMFTFKDNAT